MKRLGSEATDASRRASRRLAEALRRGHGRPFRTLGIPFTPGVDALRASGWSRARLRDFEDFVAGDPERSAGRIPLPDPSFRERLRGRLWQLQVFRRHSRGWARH